MAVFISENELFSKQFNGIEKIEYDKFYSDLIAPFYEERFKESIYETPFRMDGSKREKVLKIIEHYIDLDKSFNKVKYFFMNIQENECFYIFHDKFEQDSWFKHEFYLDTQRLLKYYNQQYDPEWVMTKSEHYSDYINYLLREQRKVEVDFKLAYFHYTKKNFLGEQDKNKRICRFCGNGKAEGATFIKEAHTLPAFLGNKVLFQNEECDECNAYFGENIENDLDNFTQLLRIFSGVKGRNDIPSIKNQDLEFFYDRNKNKVPIIAIKNNELAGTDIIRIKNEKTFIPQNVYKILCKIFFSVIDIDTLKKFDDTLKWIRYDSSFLSNLPIMAFAFLPERNLNQPYVATYIKKENSDKTPFAFAEISFGHFAYIVQIASKRNEEELFFTENKFDQFLKSISYYQRASFSYYDFSGGKPIHSYISFLNDLNT